jgi:hypothetical protein
MTTYKELFGKAVKFLSSDPTDDIEGQIWYNSTTGTFKTQEFVAAAWASGGNMGTARYILAGAGTQTAGLGFAGYPSPTGATEEYDGSAWTAGGSYPGAPKEALGGLGIQTAALGFGGYNPTPVQSATNEYDGSTWTTGGSLNTARRRCRGCGIQTAGVTAGGVTGAPNATVTGATEEYNGSTWTTVNSLSGIARRSNVLAGTQTAALSLGGATTGAPFLVEEYDGTSWTADASMPVGYGSASGDGSIIDAWIAGGANSPSPSGTTLTYNGSAWATASTMVNGRSESSFSSGGSGSSGFVGGGNIPPSTNATEEFTGAAFTTKTITTS